MISSCPAIALPAEFAHEFLPGWEFPPHVSRFQDATLELVTNAHVNRQVVEAPVRHGKSWWHSVVVPAWYCCTFPDRLVLGVSYGSNLSDTFARDVIMLIQRAAPYFGLVLDPKWTRRDSFRWYGRRGGYDSVGAGGPVSGKGYHFIACDDLVKDDEAARSPTQRATLSKWFFADLLTRTEPGAKVSLVMSRRHMSDLSGECLALNAELPPDLHWHSIKFKAIDDDGNALWPGRFSLQWLREKRTEYELRGRSYMFSSLYQQDPRADPEACEWPDSYFGPQLFYSELPPDLPVRLKIVACDPSKGAQSKSGDYCAIATMTLDRAGVLWCDVQLRRQTTPDVIDSLAATILTEKPGAAVMETHGFQEQLAIEVRKMLDAKQSIIQLHPFDSMENKEVRIRLALSEWLHRGRIRFRDTVGGRLCVAQLQEFPSGEHDDGPDVLAMGLALMGDLLS
jgi:predicted phage terminase large subunit-like protein